MSRDGRLSIWQPVHLGIGEDGQPVRVNLAERNLLVGGQPGSGKSVALNLIVGHAALAADCRLVLVDGKWVELGAWRACADPFVGPNVDDALDVLGGLQKEMDSRYEQLLDTRRRKIRPGDGMPPILVVFDELAYFSATVGDRKQQTTFTATVRDLVARGRAAGVIVIGATQRPSHDIIPTSLRDLFGYRWAFRVPTDASSDVILDHGYAARGYSAAELDRYTPGLSLLLAEDGTPQRVRSAFLSDEQVYNLAGVAARLRAPVQDTP